MSEREELLAAIISEPQDDAVRLVFADWLDENDEADRAEFIRIQIELTRRADFTTLDPLPPFGGFASQSSESLQGRARQLLALHEADWRSEFPEVGNLTGAFERGFVESVEIDNVYHGEQINRAQRFLERTPGRSLVLRDLGNIDPDDVMIVLEMGVFRNVHRLTIGRDTIFNDEVMERLIGSTDLRSLRRIEFQECTVVHLTLWSTFARSHIGRRITHLHLRGMALAEFEMRSLCESGWDELSELQIGACFLNDADIEALASHPLPPKLRSLRLPGNVFGTPAIDALIRSGVFARLVSLDLAQCEAIDHESAKALLALLNAPHLRHVAMDNTSVPFAARAQIDRRFSPADEQRTIPPTKEWTPDSSGIPSDVVGAYMPQKPIAVRSEMLVVPLLMSLVLIPFAFGFIAWPLQEPMHSDVILTMPITAITVIVMLLIQKMFIRDRSGWLAFPLVIAFAMTSGGVAWGLFRPPLAFWLLAISIVSAMIPLLVIGLLTRYVDVPSVYLRRPAQADSTLPGIVVSSVIIAIVLAIVHGAATPPGPLVFQALKGWIGYVVCLVLLLLWTQPTVMSNMFFQQLRTYESGARNERYLQIVIASALNGAYLSFRCLSEWYPSAPMSLSEFLFAGSFCALSSAIAVAILWGNPAPLARSFATVQAAFTRRERSLFVPLLIVVILTIATMALFLEKPHERT